MTKITPTDLLEMFHNIKITTNWELTKPMLWGYFFTHHEPIKLEAAKGKLLKMGYRFVKIYLADKDREAEPDLWWLHVEKEEIHTPESLDKLNHMLTIFAQENGINSYDGMDVGPI